MNNIIHTVVVLTLLAMSAPEVSVNFDLVAEEMI